MQGLVWFRSKNLVAAVFLIVLFLGSSMSADEATRTWTDSTGKHTREATFVEIDGGVVVLRLPDGKVARIPLEKLSSADQSYAKNAALTEAGEPDPFQTDSEKQGTKSVGVAAQEGSGPASLDADATLRVVVAEGVGVDVESARADAYRQAVRQVVGAFVDAGTMVDNDQLIEDRVITLSSGLVEKAEPVSESKSGGLVRMRVRATVRVTKLLDTLNAHRIATGNVDTDSLVAKVVTTADQQEGLEAILRTLLPKFHEQCFAVSVVGQPTVGKATGDSAEVRVRVSLSPNKEAFLAIASKLQTALEATPRQNGEIVSDGLRPANKGDYKQVVANIRDEALVNHNWGDLIEIFWDRTERNTVEESADRDGNSSLITYDPLYLIADPTCTRNGDVCGIEGLRWGRFEKLCRGNGTAVLIVLTKANDSYQRTQWRWFHLTKDEAQLVRKLVPKAVRCTVKLLDKSGEEITRDVLQLSRLGIIEDSTYATIALGPFFINEEISYYIPTISIERTVTLQKSEIATVGKAEVVLSEESEP